MIFIPKIIENVRELLINEAKRQISENGYDSVTIRSIAKGCGLGLGTFYNYFKSKDMLIATFLLEEWQEPIRRVCIRSDTERDPAALVSLIYSELTGFIENNSTLFNSSGAVKAFYGSVGQKHKLLRSQISEPLCRVCKAEGYENAEFLSDFVSEAVLTWTVEKKDYGEVAQVINKLFSK